MSDVKSKTVFIQGRTALGVTLGLACSIPLAAAPAMARHDDSPRPRLDRAERELRRLDNNNRDRQRGANFNAVQAAAGANLNLNSGRAIFSAGNIGNFNNLTINVGGRDKVITLDSKLTAAEVVAATQVLDGGKQEIQIRANGAAAGGTITLNAGVLSNLDKSVGGSISSLTVARGVQVVDNTSGINLSGTLRNFGTISAASEVAGTTDTISADTIFNSRGGAIGSYSGNDYFAADVALNAATSLTNNGSISSAGNLTITAPVINNNPDAGSAASITAANDININSATSILFNGTGGTLQAGNNINFNAANDITASGGNLLSQEVNFNAGAHGTVEVSVADLTGVANANACIVHLHASTENLVLGNINATGDPLITNATGNLTIDGTIIPTNGAPITMIASGNITAAPGSVLDTSNAAGAGGDVYLLAGTAFKVNKDGNFVVTKQSKTGGFINLTNLTDVDTTGTTDGGDVVMVAGFNKKTVGSGVITLPGALTIETSGGTGTDGFVQLIGGSSTGDAIVSNGTINGGDVSASAATFGTTKGGVIFAAGTGQILSGQFTNKKATAGSLAIAGDISTTGDLSFATAGTLNFVGDIFANGEQFNVTAQDVNVTTTAEIQSLDSTVGTWVVKGGVNVNSAGVLDMGTLNLTTGTITVDNGGFFLNATNNITASGNILVNGTFGRNPFDTDPSALATTFNVTTKGSINVGATGTLSGNGNLTAFSFLNDNVSQGSIVYTATSKKVGGFVNNGLIDGLAVTVNAVSIVNTGALQSTLQTNEEDIPTLTLNTQSINNTGVIQAIGVAKQSEGVLNINSTKDLLIVGDAGSFVTDFFGTVALTADGDINIGDGVNDPFSALNTGMGVFSVNTTGEFQSQMPGISVAANADGEYGTIDIVAKDIVYNGAGVAPVFNLTAVGDDDSAGVEPVSVQLTGKNGITIGGASGNLNVSTTGYDSESFNTFTTPGNLNVNMSNLILDGTGLTLVGTKNLLVNGNIVAGDEVIITTANKKAFLIGNATVAGITGIAAGEGITANESITINTPGKVTVSSTFALTAGEDVILNSPGLILENGGDILPIDPVASALEVTLNAGASSKAEYTNLNPLGFLSAAVLNLNTTGVMTLDSGGGNQVQTYLSIGQNPANEGGNPGGGSFIINAGSLKFSSRGIFFDASSDPGALNGGPNGGEVDITLTTTKIVKVGLGNGEIRADVGTTAGYDDPEGTGNFFIQTVGAIQAKEILLGAVDFGAGGGAFSLNSTTSTVSVEDVSGISLNLFQLSSGSSTTMQLENAGKNGIKDAVAVILGGNLVFENVGVLDTNGVVLQGVALTLTSQTEVDTRDNDSFEVFEVGGDGGEITISGPTLTMGTNGLLLIAEGGLTTPATVSVTTTALGQAGDIEIGPIGTRNALAIDVSDTGGGDGAIVTVVAGGNLLVDGFGLDFGLAANSVDSSLTLTSGQASDSVSGGTLTFNNANAATLDGLRYGQVFINSGSEDTFVLSGANVNSGNGFSNGALTAGQITINPRGGLGVIDTTGFAMVTNQLSLAGSTIFFDNQTIAVVADSVLVGTGAATGNGGSMIISGSDLRFDNSGGVLLTAIATTGTGGIITVNDSGTRDLEIGAEGFSFDVSNPGAQEAGTVNVTQSNADLEVDASAFEFGTNDGGVLNLDAAGNMRITNIAALNSANLSNANFVTQGDVGSTSAFQFGGAAANNGNGFVDVNPTFSAQVVTINTSGAGAGIDTSTGTIQTNDLTLTTTGNINFLSGGTLAVTSDPVNFSGGTMQLKANSLTQTGVGGFTLAAVAAPGGQGGNISVTITGTDTFQLGGGFLNVDVSNDGAGSGGGSFQLINGGNINADLSAVDFGSNFGGDGPTLLLQANGILNVANASTVANLGDGTNVTFSSRSSQAFVLGGAAAGTNGIQDNGLTYNISDLVISNTGLAQTATVAGNITPGLTDTIIVTDSSLPDGFVEVSYTFVTGDTRDTIAAALAAAINGNLDLAAIGVTATSDGNVVNLVASGVGTTFATEVDKGSRLELETTANGGNIEMGTATSLTGANSGTVTLTASNSIGTVDQFIELNAGAGGSVILNAGNDAFVTTVGDVSAFAYNVGDVATIDASGGDVGNMSGTVGSLNFQWSGPGANTNSVTVGSLTSTNGDLLVQSQAETLTITGSTTANFGNIIFLNQRLGGAIDIQDGTELTGRGAVTALNQGNVYIGYDDLNVTFVDGVQPAGTTVIETAGGEVTFSQAPAAAGTITADPTAIFQALGRDIRFWRGPTGAEIGITVGQDVVITADPPNAGGHAAIMQNIADIAAANQGGRFTPNNTFGTSAANLGATASNNVSLTSASNNTGITMPAINTNDVGSALGAINTISLNNAQATDLSTLRYSALNSQTALGGVIGMTNASTGGAVQTAASGNGNATLVGEVSNFNHRSLERGPLLVSPQEDLVVDTPHGTVHVAGKSLALIIVNDQGVSVYNMHDKCKHAVKLVKDNHHVSVSPGTFAMLTGVNAVAFEDVNPAQFVGYRQPSSHTLNHKTKLFKAEFEVLGMLSALPGFKDLMNSESAETRKTMMEVLKTQAVLMHLGAGREQFKQYVKPEVTALAK